MSDNVNHPKHYTEHPSGVECIQITEHMNFNVGNTVKYLWRADLKNDALEDLRKAQWYLTREIERLEHSEKHTLALGEFVMGEKVVYMGDVVTILDCNVDSDQYHIRAMTGAKVWVKAKRISKMQVV